MAESDIIIASVALAVWLYLIVGRGAFWLASERDDGSPSLRDPSPSVIAIVPARDEAECVAESVGSLLRQRYPGEFSVILIDDQSSDGTAEIAQRTANALEAAHRLTIVSGQAPPAGWTGKLWAQQQGIEHAQRHSPPSYLLLTDADIVHAPDTLAWLVAQAQSTGSVSVSLMAKLHCESFAERLLIPAFIFFFQMLYPFAWVNNPRRATAAAAGGCMLVRWDELQRAGGLAAIRDAVIDDCALAKRLKRCGPIWLGLTERLQSIRVYPRMGDIRQMVARTAYAQLNYSPALLAATIAGLALVYLVPPLFALFGHGLARAAGIIGWAAMAIAFAPTLRLYRMSPLWGFALPAIALVYMAFTIDSGFQHAKGRGALWKGRIPHKA